MGMRTCFVSFLIFLPLAISSYSYSYDRKLHTVQYLPSFATVSSGFPRLGGHLILFLSAVIGLGFDGCLS